ncbi:hypothetical protein F4680DRAFT_303261 [Xylaria scruposa]|nr:hypothetical protein F4680DRAFT_303261 [Xylaria scruposa]
MVGPKVMCISRLACILFTGTGGVLSILSPIFSFNQACFFPTEFRKSNQLAKFSTFQRLGSFIFTYLFHPSHPIHPFVQTSFRVCNYLPTYLPTYLRTHACACVFSYPSPPTESVHLPGPDKKKREGSFQERGNCGSIWFISPRGSLSKVVWLIDQIASHGWLAGWLVGWVGFVHHAFFEFACMNC